MGSIERNAATPHPKGGWVGPGTDAPAPGADMPPGHQVPCFVLLSPSLSAMHDMIHCTLQYNHTMTSVQIAGPSPGTASGPCHPQQGTSSPTAQGKLLKHDTICSRSRDRIGGFFACVMTQTRVLEDLLDHLDALCPR